ncbi:MAG: translation initiation factor IF-2 [Candidatus Nealsonbacteria bacterium]|nr:translation initiation factor IF-2 [Candidatus Nealsonbacteria bacterium]
MNKKVKESLFSRPPIVVVMGHIDHGKTTLLDQIRKTHVVEKESGGITQHIGAYQVILPDAKTGDQEQGKKITFLDTPGHEAFFQMRSRGAKVADIVVLVIDAAEGLKVQTKEVISHIKKLEIPAIVVLNKMDKPGADPEKVKRELFKEGMVVESMGGEIPTVQVSAKTGKGIPELLEMILLIAEMEKLTADLKKPGEGVVIESYLDNFRGPTATLLLFEGTLKTGDVVATHSAFTKIKNLENFQKKALDQALPSDPVIIFGFDQAPKAGEEFKVFPDLTQAQDYIQSSKDSQLLTKESSINDPKEESGIKTLNIVLKTDVAGSSEAIEGILKNIPQDKVALKILKSEVGNINESDIKLVKGGRGLILGFRVKTDSSAKKILERERIKIMNFDVIYEMVEEMRTLMEKALEMENIRNDSGKLKVLVKFFKEGNRQIVGGKVIEGEIERGSLIEVMRDEEKVGEGRMVNLQRDKKDAESVSKGQECGILFEGGTEIKEGDILNIFTREKKRGTL